MALMNMVSSNINQWTLLTAMLPIVFSLSKGAPTAIVFDSQQELELLMTLGQSVVGTLFLINMELAWWEATALFVLFFVPFTNPAAAMPVTILYFAWAAVELIRLVGGRRRPAAFELFLKTWMEHVGRAA